MEHEAPLFAVPAAAGRHRPFLRSMLFAFLTFGLYLAWWHWRAHEEVHRQFGWRNKDAAWWVRYLVLAVLHGIGVLSMLFVLGWRRVSAGEPLPELGTLIDELRFIATANIWAAVLIACLTVGLEILFLYYAMRQYAVLGHGMRKMGEAAPTTKPAFLFVFVLNTAILWFAPPLAFVTYVMSPVPFALLLWEYNRLWRAVRARTGTPWAKRVRDQVPGSGASITEPSTA